MGAKISKEEVMLNLGEVKDYVGQNAVMAWMLDNPWTSLGIVLGSKILLWDWLLFRIRNRNLPPGPIGMPVIGSLGIMSETFYKDLTQLGHKYGEVVYLRMPQRDLVVLNSTNAIKEAFVRRGGDFNNRHRSKLLNSIDFQDELFTAEYSEAFVAHKKFVFNALRTFGMGTKAKEDSIQEQVDNLCDLFRKQNGRPIDPDKPLQKVTANLTCSLLFNKKYSFDDPLLEAAVGQATGFYKALTEGFLYILFPKCIGKLLNPKVITMMHDQAVGIQSFIQGHVQEHQDTFDPDNVRDVCDYYLKERSDIDPKTLRDNLTLLYPDSIYAVAMLLRWLLLYTLSSPDVKEKLYKEIDEVVGQSRNPCFDDLAKLTYTEAIIKETLRLCNFIPVIASHAPSADSKLLGYNIPKNADIMANVYSIHFDEELYPEPHSFKPERFLDGNGKLILTENFFCFGKGPRMCMGEKVAKQEMILIVANLVQKFHLKFPADKPNPTWDPAPGVFGNPRSFEIVAIPK